MFWSEFLIVLSSLQTKSLLLTGAAIVMLFNVAFSIGYYFRIIRVVAFNKQSDYLATARFKPRSAVMLVPCVVLLALSLITGFFPDTFYQPILNGVHALFPGT